MKKLIFTIAGLLLFVTPAISIAGGVAAQFSSGFTVEADEANLANCLTGGVCTGDLVTCGNGETISIAAVTYHFLNEICDDADFPSCGGRFTGLVETCHDPTLGTGDLKINGLVLSINRRGAFRICFSDSAAWADCKDATKPVDGIVIVEGDIRMQTTQFFPGGPSHAIGATNLTASQLFRDPADGKRKQLKNKVVFPHVTSQPISTGCGAPGSPCGSAGTSLLP